MNRSLNRIANSLPPGRTARAATAGLRRQVDRLRTELSDLAFSLDRQGRGDAADLAASVATRLAEISAGSADRRSSRPAPRVRIAPARRLNN